MGNEALAQEPFGMLALAGAANPDGINQSEQVVQLGVTPRGLRDAAIKRSQRHPLNGSLGIWPDGWGVAILGGEGGAEHGSGPSGGHPAGELTQTYGERVGEAMDDEVHQGRAPHLLGLRIQQSSFSQPPHGSVSLSNAEAKIARQVHIAWPISCQGQF